MTRLLVAALLGMLASTASAQQPAIMGTWLSASGVAQVRIGPCPDQANGPLCGVIVGLIQGPQGDRLRVEQGARQGLRHGAGGRGLHCRRQRPRPEIR